MGNTQISGPHGAPTGLAPACKAKNFLQGSLRWDGGRLTVSQGRWVGGQVGKGRWEDGEWGAEVRAGIRQEVKCAIT